MRKFQLLNRSPKNYKIVMLLVISLLCGTGFSQSEGLLSENVVFTTEIAEDASPAVLARFRQAKQYPITKIIFDPLHGTISLLKYSNAGEIQFSIGYGFKGS